MRATSDGFTSLSMRGDRKEEGGRQRQSTRTVGDEEKAREECETHERGVGDGGGQ